jgi:signal transduction protein with GAF and PtsI domain
MRASSSSGNAADDAAVDSSDDESVEMRLKSLESRVWSLQRMTLDLRRELQVTNSALRDLTEHLAPIPTIVHTLQQQVAEFGSWAEWLGRLVNWARHFPWR